MSFEEKHPLKKVLWSFFNVFNTVLKCYKNLRINVKNVMINRDKRLFDNILENFQLLSKKNRDLYHF